MFLRRNKLVCMQSWFQRLIRIKVLVLQRNNGEKGRKKMFFAEKENLRTVTLFRTNIQITSFRYKKR